MSDSESSVEPGDLKIGEKPAQTKFYPKGAFKVIIGVLLAIVFLCLVASVDVTQADKEPSEEQPSESVRDPQIPLLPLMVEQSTAIESTIPALIADSKVDTACRTLRRHWKAVLVVTITFVVFTVAAFALAMYFEQRRIELENEIMLRQEEERIAEEERLRQEAAKKLLPSDKHTIILISKSMLVVSIILTVPLSALCVWFYGFSISLIPAILVSAFLLQSYLLVLLSLLYLIGGRIKCNSNFDRSLSNLLRRFAKKIISWCKAPLGLLLYPTFKALQLYDGGEISEELMGHA